MRVLFIGGTGIISSACSQIALESGIDLVLLNRGNHPRPVPEGAEVVIGDIRDGSGEAALRGREFDVVVDWIAFTTDHVRQDLELFEGRTGQYVFISSASAYQTPPTSLPVTESTVLRNPVWEYSRNKIACEEMLVQTHRDRATPITIVRPSHTYDRTLLPFDHGYTVVDRMRKGLPVIVHGDGTSLWTLTHHEDFARAFVPLLGNHKAIGEAVHITSDEWLPWNRIYELVAKAAGAEAKLVHVPSDLIAKHDAGWGASLLGDKAHSMVFDNTKAKRLAPGWCAKIPFERGAEEIMAWHDADPARRKVDARANELEDQLIQLVTR